MSGAVSLTVRRDVIGGVDRGVVLPGHGETSLPVIYIQDAITTLDVGAFADGPMLEIQLHALDGGVGEPVGIIVLQAAWKCPE